MALSFSLFTGFSSPLANVEEPQSLGAADAVNFLTICVLRDLDLGRRQAFSIGKCLPKRQRTSEGTLPEKSTAEVQIRFSAENPFGKRGRRGTQRHSDRPARTDPLHRL